MQVPSCRSTQPGLEEEAEDLEKSLVLFLKHRLFSLSTCLLARSLKDLPHYSKVASLSYLLTPYHTSGAPNPGAADQHQSVAC